jgi:hypothetical protein
LEKPSRRINREGAKIAKDRGSEGFRTVSSQLQEPKNNLTASDLYEHVTRNLHYYLEWRAKLLAGYFATWLSLGIAFAWSWAHRHDLRILTIAIPFIIAAFVSLLFWGLDHRNRENYRGLLDAGDHLEEGIKITGPYHHLNKLPKGISHSHILNTMFVLAALLSAVFGIYLWSKTP